MDDMSPLPSIVQKWCSLWTHESMWRRPNVEPIMTESIFRKTLRCSLTFYCGQESTGNNWRRVCDLYCSRTPGGDWGVLASLLGSSHVIHLYILHKLWTKCTFPLTLWAARPFLKFPLSEHTKALNPFASYLFNTPKCKKRSIWLQSYALDYFLTGGDCRKSVCLPKKWAIIKVQHVAFTCFV